MRRPTLRYSFKLPAVALFLFLLLTAITTTPTTAYSTEATPRTATATCPAGGIIYVKEGGAGNQNGTSWSNAMPYLQQALTMADNCQIWVAQGTYQPDDGGIYPENDQNASFFLKATVALYGGFVGNETQLSQRNWEQNETSLSGYIGQGRTFTIVKSLNVDASAILDGFTIIGASGWPQYTSQGGGIQNIDSSPTLRNLLITGNTEIALGGGIYNRNSHPTIANVTITGNLVSGSGGGIFNFNSNPKITDSKINLNRAIFASGGGVYNGNNSNPVFNNVDIIQNFAQGDGGNGGGGGIANRDSNPTLINMKVNNNSTGQYGGGIYNQASNPLIINVQVGGNSATWGGGFTNLSSNPTLTNVSVTGNLANRFGGGFFNLDSNPTIVNTLISNNTATNDTTRAQLFNDACHPDFSVCNNPNATSIPKISYSLVQGSGGSDSWNTQMGQDLGNNIDGTSLFGALFRYSPVIDAGTTNVSDLPDKDLADNPRIQGSNIDIGAYELPDKPTPSDEQYDTLKGQAITVAAPGVLENDMMRHDVTLAVYSPPANGQVTELNQDGSFTYQPNADYCGADSFIYELRDTFDQIGLGTVTITMDCSPAIAPVARDDNYTTLKNTSFSAIPAGFLDNDSVTGTISISIFSPPANGELLMFEEDGSFVYVPDEDYCYADSFIYEIKNLHGQSDFGKVTVTMDCSPQLDNKVYIPIVVR